jgi:hypothetical protein
MFFALHNATTCVAVLKARNPISPWVPPLEPLTVVSSGPMMTKFGLVRDISKHSAGVVGLASGSFEYWRPHIAGEAEALRAKTSAVKRLPRRTILAAKITEEEGWIAISPLQVEKPCQHTFQSSLGDIGLNYTGF